MYPRCSKIEFYCQVSQDFNLLSLEVETAVYGSNYSWLSVWPLSRHCRFSCVVCSDQPCFTVPNFLQTRKLHSCEGVHKASKEENKQFGPN